MSVCWGNYVSFRLMQRLGRRRSLHLDNKTARPRVVRELDAMIAEAGGCAA